MTRGKFITFEGTEGVGKSTQVKLLADYLEKTGQPYLLTREPGGEVIAESIRKIILDAKNTSMCDEAEALLYAASRAQLVKNVILPALEEGKTVICDRYVHSSVVYQCYGRGLSEKFVLDINAFALENCPPDLTILLELPPDVAFKRKGGADKTDRVEQSGEQFFDRVAFGYSKINEKDEKVLTIVPLGEREETSQTIINALKERGLIK
ncbi:MAG: dTMP kinase [Clostridia bacterium]|nr:dTMP kinase [Clostridia bacterium]